MTTPASPLSRRSFAFSLNVFSISVVLLYLKSFYVRLICFNNRQPLTGRRVLQVPVLHERPERLYLIGHLVYQVDPLYGLGGRDPREVEPAHVYAGELKEVLKANPPSAGVVVAGGVVAVPGGAAGYQHAVGPVLEGLYCE